MDKNKISTSLSDNMNYFTGSFASVEKKPASTS